MHFSKLVAVAALAILAVACSAPATTPTGGANQGGTPVPGAVETPAVTDAASSPAPVGGTVDTCALLSTADLTATLGSAVAAGSVDAAGQCVWTTQNGILVLFVQDVALDFIKSSFPGGVDTTVSGRAAYWNPAQGLQSLWVDVGDGRTLVLSFPMSTDLDAGDQANAQKLAEIAIGKL